MITKVRIEITGTAPLLHHNIRLANPLDPIARQMKVISGKRKKTDEDYAELSRLEFLGSLYHHPELGPYVKGVSVEKSLVEGGRITKQGKQVERALFVFEPEISLIYDGPRGADDLFADANFVDVQAVKVGQSRVMRTRPIYRSWRLMADAQLDTTVLNLETLQSIADDAGSMVGIGDYRPRYGRYVARVTKL